ncbi:hypothetical protein ACQ4PT_066943 [Festuca glaucescens]
MALPARSDNRNYKARASDCVVVISAHGATIGIGATTIGVGGCYKLRAGDSAKDRRRCFKRAAAVLQMDVIAASLRRCCFQWPPLVLSAATVGSASGRQSSTDIFSSHGSALRRSDGGGVALLKGDNGERHRCCCERVSKLRQRIPRRTVVLPARSDYRNCKARAGDCVAAISTRGATIGAGGCYNRCRGCYRRRAGDAAKGRGRCFKRAAEVLQMDVVEPPPMLLPAAIAGAVSGHRRCCDLPPPMLPAGVKALPSSSPAMGVPYRGAPGVVLHCCKETTTSATVVAASGYRSSDNVFSGNGWGSCRSDGGVVHCCKETMASEEPRTP